MANDPPVQHETAEETRRLATLHALDLLDSEPESEFDALVALAAEMLDCPTALLTLIDRDRQWIKARTGSDLAETPRQVAFCHHTIGTNAPMIVDDATLDARFALNPLVTADGGIRFYAGAPIHAVGPDGGRQPIGALCVIDTNPRQLDDAGRRALANLATIAETVIAARATARDAVALARISTQQAANLRRQDLVFRQAERMAAIGSWRLQLDGSQLEWSEGVFRIYGLPVGETPSLEAALDQYPLAARTAVVATLARTADTATSFDVEADFLNKAGNLRRVRIIGELETRSGEPDALMGIFQDITDRHMLEESLRGLANRDDLTQIANRAAFDRTLNERIGVAKDNGTPLALVLIDLDGFKRINDTLGHLAGDDVLRTVGRRLSEPWLGNSFAARIGGDEFALIVDDPRLVADPDAVVARLEAALCINVTKDNLTMAVSASVGAALLTNKIRTIHDFVNIVDTLLYAVKRQRVGDRRAAQ